jgi:hypothetical protein
MYKSFLIFLLFMVVMTNVCWGQSFFHSRVYGGNDYDQAEEVIALNDGNLMVAARTNSFDLGTQSIWLLKIKPNGDTVWTRFYGNKKFTVTPSALLQLPNGDVLMAGNYMDYLVSYDIPTPGSIWLIRINPQGDTLWTKSFTKGSSLSCYSMILDHNGTILILAKSEYPNSFSGVEVLSVSGTGALLGSRSYSCEGDKWVEKMILEKDGAIIETGASDKGYQWLKKVSSDGKTLWRQDVDSNIAMVNTNLPLLLKTNDGNYLVTGKYINWESGPLHPWIRKVDSQGVTLWHKSFDEIEGQASAILESPNGTITVVGSNDFEELWIFTIDQKGELISSTIGFSSGSPLAIGQLSNGVSFIVGLKRAGLDEPDVWIQSVVNEQFASYNHRFTFHIPSVGDSLKHSYVPLIVPKDMSVSPGGTISWTPSTDSTYTQKVAYLVIDDFGEKDTLQFHLWVNTSTPIHTAINPKIIQADKQNPFFVRVVSIGHVVRFTFSSIAMPIKIYDLYGRLVQSLQPTREAALIVWNGDDRNGRLVAAGKYLAQVGFRKADILLITLQGVIK